MSPINGWFAGGVARRLVCISALTMLLCTHDRALASSSQPNIVVILTDDAGYNQVGFNSQLMGQTPYVQTPNLDALAQRSVVARNGYVTSPLCGPSRAGLLTGQYPQRYGFEYNGGTLSPQQITIAQHLKDLGYSTGAVGKWHLGSTDDLDLPLDKGFDEFFGLWGGGRDYFFDTRPGNEIRRGDTFYEHQYRVEGNPAEYDPIKGRYVTDAFGDEAADFINRRGAEANPYFLYLSFTSPHSPVQAKQADLDHFAHIADPSKRTISAMQYAMDRSVGKVVDAIQTTGEDTIVIFTNDNGGPPGWDNQPLRGHKGLIWEGGIRVPFFINAPGLQPGVFDAPITTNDILPTLYAAAGGNLAQLPTDGVDLMPHLSGINPNNPHEALVWRINGLWAVRKGDWKLEQPDGSGVRLVNLATDPTESINVMNQNPAIVEDLLRELTYWEAKVRKPEVNEPGYIVNRFNHFVFAGNSAWFNVQGAWINPATGNAATLTRFDGDPNLILEFQTKDNGSYGAFNSHLRGTGQTYMLNEIRFTGNFTGPLGTLGGFSGNPLLFVKNLDGAAPTLRLDATSTGTNAKFRFDISSELQLFDDLEITGDGTQNFSITSTIRDYYEPRSVTKTGSSVLNLAVNNTFKGDLNVLGGQIKLTGPSAAINGARSVVIGSGASLAMDGGLIDTPVFANAAGGTFQFTGGELRTTSFVGNLNNQGGNFSPGNPLGVSTITGNLTQNSASKLTIELGGTVPGLQFDRLNLAGSANLDGQLIVNLIHDFLPTGGESFNFLAAAGGINGTFANTILPTLSSGLAWRIVYGPTTTRFVVDVTGGATTFTIPGDYNFNGVVNAADYVVWRNSLGSTTNLIADGNGDGVVDNNDYDIWRANFGRTALLAALGAAADRAIGAVPEPSTFALCAFWLLAILLPTRRRAT